MKSKKGFEFSFAWFFALVVGSIIIFLAIYAAVKFGKTLPYKQDTELGKELGIILNPVETTLETGKTNLISLNEEIRIFNKCQTLGTFGIQEISTATRSLNKEWQKPALPAKFHNKYIFSEKMIESDSYIVFAKPFEMPFKIADLIYLWPDKEHYCFVNPPQAIEEEIEDLSIRNLNLTSSISECNKNAKKVCFNSKACDFEVSLDTSGFSGSIKKKNSNRVYFDSPAMLYAAIFSDPEIYECQVKRLAKRISELALLYNEKTLFLSSKGCSSNLESELLEYSKKAFSINNSLEFRDIKFFSDNIRRTNNGLSCKLF